MEDKTSYYSTQFYEEDFKKSLLNTIDFYFQQIIKCHYSLYRMKIDRAKVSFRFNFIEFSIKFDPNLFYITIEEWHLYHDLGRNELFSLFIGNHEKFGNSFLADLERIILQYKTAFISSIHNFLDAALDSVIQERHRLESKNIRSADYFRLPQIIVTVRKTESWITHYKRGEGWWDVDNFYFEYSAIFANSEYSPEFQKKTYEYLEKISNHIGDDRGYRNYKFGKSCESVDYDKSRYLIFQSKLFHSDDFPVSPIDKTEQHLDKYLLKLYLIFLFCDFKKLTEYYFENFFKKDRTKLYFLYDELDLLLQVLKGNKYLSQYSSHEAILKNKTIVDLVENMLNEKFRGIDYEKYLDYYLINFTRKDGWYDSRKHLYNFFVEKLGHTSTV